MGQNDWCNNLSNISTGGVILNDAINRSFGKLNFLHKTFAFGVLQHSLIYDKIQFSVIFAASLDIDRLGWGLIITNSVLRGNPADDKEAVRSATGNDAATEEKVARSGTEAEVKTVEDEEDVEVVGVAVVAKVEKVVFVEALVTVVV